MMPTVDLFLVYITKSSLKYGFNSLLFNLDTPLGGCTVQLNNKHTLLHAQSLCAVLLKQ